MKNYTFESLTVSVEEWAEAKGIMANATPMAQGLKTLEEVTELLNAIRTNNNPEIQDAIGDIIVTLIIQAKMNNLNIVDCLESAYNIIAKRKGKMVNGVFVKDN
jgi:NTP pyrophosphatase (non-canonical NTP hydrolase)